MAATRAANTPFVVALLLFLAVMEFVCFLATQNTSRSPDFRGFYAAGYIARTHPSRLYDMSEQEQVQSTRAPSTAPVLPFIHPSYEALLYLPFSLLNFRGAYTAFIAFNVLVLLGVFTAGGDLYRVEGASRFSREGLLLFFYVPVLIAIFQGQDSVVFLFLCTAAWRLLQRGQDKWAGVLIALALFRFQLALPLALLVGVRRGKRFFAGFAVGAVAVVLLCVALVGKTGLVSLVHLLSAMSLSGNQTVANQQAMLVYPRAMPNLLGLLYACGTRLLPARAAFLAVLGSSLGVLLISMQAMRKLAREDVAFALALCCSVLVSYHLYPHDATALLLPLSMAVRTGWSMSALVCFWSPLLIIPWGPAWWYLLAVPLVVLWLGFVRSANAPSVASGGPPSAPTDFVYSR